MERRAATTLAARRALHPSSQSIRLAANQPPVSMWQPAPIGERALPAFPAFESPTARPARRAGDSTATSQVPSTTGALDGAAARRLRRRRAAASVCETYPWWHLVIFLGQFLPGVSTDAQKAVRRTGRWRR